MEGQGVGAVGACSDVTDAHCDITGVGEADW